MKLTKKYLIPAIIFFILFAAMVGINDEISALDKQTLHTTYEFTATVTDVEVRQGAELYVTIHTEEFGDALTFYSSATKHLNLEEITALKKGQVITFRIENRWLQRFAEAGLGLIVELKTEEKEILSLTEHNQYQHESVMPPRIACLVIMFGSLALGWYFLLKPIINLHRKKNKQFPSGNFYRGDR